MERSEIGRFRIDGNDGKRKQPPVGGCLAGLPLVNYLGGGVASCWRSEGNREALGDSIPHYEVIALKFCWDKFTKFTPESKIPIITSRHGSVSPCQAHSVPLNLQTSQRLVT